MLPSPVVISEALPRNCGNRSRDPQTNIRLDLKNPVEEERMECGRQWDKDTSRKSTEEDT